ncbi:hypothetical protein ACWDR2_34810 [Streptomyces sp. NPDC003631]
MIVWRGIEPGEPHTVRTVDTSAHEEDEVARYANSYTSDVCNATRKGPGCRAERPPDCSYQDSRAIRTEAVIDMKGVYSRLALTHTLTLSTRDCLLERFRNDMDNDQLKVIIAVVVGRFSGIVNDLTVADEGITYDIPVVTQKPHARTATVTVTGHARCKCPAARRTVLFLPPTLDGTHPYTPWRTIWTVKATFLKERISEVRWFDADPRGQLRYALTGWPTVQNEESIETVVGGAAKPLGLLVSARFGTVATAKLDRALEESLAPPRGSRPTPRAPAVAVSGTIQASLILLLAASLIVALPWPALRSETQAEEAPRPPPIAPQAWVDWVRPLAIAGACAVAISALLSWQGFRRLDPAVNEWPKAPVLISALITWWGLLLPYVLTLVLTARVFLNPHPTLSKWWRCFTRADDDDDVEVDPRSLLWYATSALGALALALLLLEAASDLPWRHGLALVGSTAVAIAAAAAIPWACRRGWSSRWDRSVPHFGRKAPYALAGIAAIVCAGAIGPVVLAAATTPPGVDEPTGQTPSLLAGLAGGILWAVFLTLFPTTNALRFWQLLGLAVTMTLYLPVAGFVAWLTTGSSVTWDLSLEQGFTPAFGRTLTVVALNAVGLLLLFAAVVLLRHQGRGAGIANPRRTALLALAMTLVLINPAVSWTSERPIRVVAIEVSALGLIALLPLIGRADDRAPQTGTTSADHSRHMRLLAQDTLIRRTRQEIWRTTPTHSDTTESTNSSGTSADRGPDWQSRWPPSTGDDADGRTTGSGSLAAQALAGHAGQSPWETVELRRHVPLPS